VSFLTILVSGTAFAGSFPRNLSGAWQAPGIGSVVIVHDPDSEQAKFVLTVSSSRIPDEPTMTFSGSVHKHGNSAQVGATEFIFNGDATPFAFRRGAATCDVQGSFSVTGQLLGQLGIREIDADICGYQLFLACRTPGRNVVEREVAVDANCRGTWR
jgi:hypothetical protein